MSPMNNRPSEPVARKQRATANQKAKGAGRTRVDEPGVPRRQAEERDGRHEDELPDRRGADVWREEEGVSPRPPGQDQAEHAQERPP